MGFIFVMATMNLATINFNLLIWCSRKIIIYGENSWATQKLWNLRYIFFQDSMIKDSYWKYFVKIIHFFEQFNAKYISLTPNFWMVVYIVWNQLQKKGDFIRL